MKILIKSNMRLLLRSWAFWFFLVLTPLLSTVILKIKFDSSAAYESAGYDELAGTKIRELSAIDQKVAYYGGNGECVIKVYDGSGSEASDYLLNKLAESGLFRICRVNLTDKNVNTEPVTEETVLRQIRVDGFSDRMGAALFLTPDFERALAQGNIAEAAVIYILSDDPRTEALEQELSVRLTGLGQYGRNEDDPESGISVKALQEFDSHLPKKKVVNVAVGNEVVLNVRQTNQKTQMGYALAFMTLGFVFCGIFVAHTSIQEQKNGVYTRIGLAKTDPVKYFLSKLITTFFVAILLTMVLGLYSFTLSTEDIGMNKGSFLILMFLLGLIFSSLSALAGILIGEVMSANIAAFALWCLSALFSGLYFPLNNTSAGIKALSSLMPQTWFLKGVEKIFVGDNSAYSMLICITVAYLLVILSLGSLGLKLRRSNGWGNS